jgi:capsular polysaccharide biosynthesis protein
VRDTQLIKLDVEDSDPARAAQIANTIVDEFIQYIQCMQSARYTVSKQNLETQIEDLNQQIQAINQDPAGLVDTPDNQAERDRLEANLIQYRQSYTNLLQSYEEIRMVESQSTTEVIQVEVAVPPEKPIRPRVIVNALLAAVVGGMLAIGAVFFIEALDDTIKNPDEIGRLFNLPMLGIIFRHDTSNGKPISIEKPPAQVTEAFRSLRANIQYASVDKPIHSLMVTGPTPDVGKTTLSANLAIVLSQGGSRVVLVDTDLRRPDLA